ILFVFKVGHSVHRRRNSTREKTHHWRCTVESWSDQYPLSEFVNNVVFQLHETFKNPRQVVHREPFTIEEDGFGSFRLFARVSFLNVFTDLHYDITLFDNRELHAFRTVRLDPKNSEEWIRYSQYGGIPIPRSASSLEIQQRVVEPIQMSGSKCNYTVFSFYPEIAMAVLNPAVRTSGLKYASPNSLRNRPNRESRTQALANLGLPVTTASPAASNPTSLPSMGVLGPHPPSHLPSSFKHKKKLQLKHEAQLRLENQHHRDPVSPPPTPASSSLRLPLVPSTNSSSLSFTSQSVQKERIVLRLFRSDLQGSVEKEKRKKNGGKHKHRHRHHRQIELGQQQQSRPEVWSSTSGTLLRTTPSQFQHAPLALLEVAGEKNRLHQSSSSSEHAVESSSCSLFLPGEVPVSKASSSVERQVKSTDSSESTAAINFPQLDAQHATMVWISKLNGGPQPLVSPLPPHTNPRLFHPSPPPHPPSSEQQQRQQKFPIDRVEKASKGERNKESKNFHQNQEQRTSKHDSSPYPTPSTSTRQDAYDHIPLKGLKRRSDCIDVDSSSSRKIPREKKHERRKSVKSFRSKTLDQSSPARSTVSSDSTPPMSGEALVHDHPTTTAPASAGTTKGIGDEVYLNNEELERLYDRVLCLENECMALRMAEVLRRYFRPGEDCGIDILAPSDELPDYPQIIAFDMHKMPLACVLEMTEVISADERMSAQRRTGVVTRDSSVEDGGDGGREETRVNEECGVDLSVGQVIGLLFPPPTVSALSGRSAADK
ncbi:Protein ENL, partial [Taenia solium]